MGAFSATVHTVSGEELDDGTTMTKKLMVAGASVLFALMGAIPAAAASGAPNTDGATSMVTVAGYEFNRSRAYKSISACTTARIEAEILGAETIGCLEFETLGGAVYRYFYRFL